MGAGLGGEEEADGAEVAFDFGDVGGDGAGVVVFVFTRFEHADGDVPVARQGEFGVAAETRRVREADHVRLHVDGEAVFGVEDRAGFVVDLSARAEELRLQLFAVGGEAAPVGVDEHVCVYLVSDLAGQVEEAESLLRGVGGGRLGGGGDGGLFKVVAEGVHFGLWLFGLGSSVFV